MTVRRTVFLRVSYDPSTVCSQLVRRAHDVRDDSSTINGDACMVLQDVTTIVLRLPTLCIWCRYDLAASSRRQLKMDLNCIVVGTYLRLMI